MILLYNIIKIINIPAIKRGIYKVPWHQYTKREKTFLDIFINNNITIKSLLCVGFRNWDDERNHWWIKFCDINGIKWNILEIFKNNVIESINSGCSKDNIINGDLLKTDSYNNYDCILFWHGPEHINKDSFINNLSAIENKTNKVIIFGMPNGEEIQGEIYGNKYEEHISSWNKYDWDKLNYKTIILDDRAPGIGHITAYKIFN